MNSSEALPNPSLLLHSSLLVPGRFDGRNYLGWSRLVLLALGGRNGYLQHIDGSASAPALPTKPISASTLDEKEAQAQKEDIAAYESKVKELSEWERIDCQVRSLILHGLTQELAELFVFYPSARELWIEIERRFGASIEPQLFHLRGLLQVLSQGNDSVVVYYNKLKDLWNQIDALRPPPPVEGAAGLIMRETMESDRLQKFLQGLDHTYSSLANQIIATQPLPTVDAAYRLVLTAETRLNAASIKDSSEDTSSVFTANHRIPQQRTPGNQQGSITPHVNSNKSKLKCSYCHKTGHLRDRCYKLHGRANILAKDSAARGNFAAVENTPFENRSTGISSPEMGGPYFSPDFNQFVKNLNEAYQAQLPPSNNDGNMMNEEHTIGPTK